MEIPRQIAMQEFMRVQLNSNAGYLFHEFIAEAHGGHFLALIAAASFSCSEAPAVAQEKI